MAFLVWLWALRRNVLRAAARFMPNFGSPDRATTARIDDVMKKVDKINIDGSFYRTVKISFTRTK